MPKAQQTEFHRSERGANDESSVKEHLTAESTPATTGAPGPVPEDNLPGHHPDHEQDKPVRAFRQRARKVADEAHAHELTPTPTSFRVDRMTFSALEAGPRDGEVVILLHGFPQGASSWSPTMEVLAEHGFRCVAPDQRGYAEEARPHGVSAYRIDCLVGDVLGIADELKAERFHVVGHDWGGVVTWAVAARHPDRVVSATVVSTPHPRAYLGALFRSPQLLRSSYIGLFAIPAVPETVLGAGGGFLLRRMLTGSGLPAARARDYADAMVHGGALSSALNWYRALPLAGAGIGDRVSVPTLYVWGEGDPALGRVAARATARQVTGPYRYEVLSGAGHWIPEVHANQLCTHLVGHLERYSEAADRA